MLTRLERFLTSLQFDYGASPEWQEVLIEVDLPRPPKAATHQGIFPIDLALIEAGLGCGTSFEPRDGAHEILERPPRAASRRSRWRVRVRCVSAELMARLAYKAFLSFESSEQFERISLIGRAPGVRC